MPLVTSGVEHGNLRELALARLDDWGSRCRDVRTREVGIQEIHHRVRPYEVSVHQGLVFVPLSFQTDRVRNNLVLLISFRCFVCAEYVSFRMAHIFVRPVRYCYHDIS